MTTKQGPGPSYETHPIDRLLDDGAGSAITTVPTKVGATVAPEPPQVTPEPERDQGGQIRGS